MIGGDLSNAKRFVSRSAPWIAMFECGSAGRCQCLEMAFRQEHCEVSIAGDESDDRRAFRREGEQYVLNCGKIAGAQIDVIERKVAQAQPEPARGVEIKIMGATSDAQAHPPVDDCTIDFLRFQDGHWRSSRLDRAATLPEATGEGKGMEA